ncbi:hypothetical protein WIS52_28140 [Pseudonocardia nematodicida]|uniref:DUF4386 family protein n=1 Tax=Pseudonocardia nematodicida TaxID=1206997 RepID=A0ABV1KIS9_9PSEU
MTVSDRTISPGTRPAPPDPARRRLVVGGGAMLVASAALSLAGGVLHPVVDGNAHSVESLLAPGSPWGQLLIYAGALALMFGLPAAWAWFAPRSGVLGALGFGLYFLGNAVSAQGHLVVEGLVAPAIARAAPELIPDDGSIIASAPFAMMQMIGGLTLLAGLALMGVALMRTAGVPRWIGAAALAGALLLFVPLPEMAVLTGLHVELLRGIAVAGLGVVMIREVRGAGSAR